MPRREVITTDVCGCARCGGDHDKLEFFPFTRMSRVGGKKVTHWATCPATGEPIFMITE